MPMMMMMMMMMTMTDQPTRLTETIIILVSWQRTSEWV